MYYSEYSNHLKLVGYTKNYYTHTEAHLKYCALHKIDPLQVKYIDISNEILELKNNKRAEGYINNRIFCIRHYYNFLKSQLNVISEDTLNEVFKVATLRIPKKAPCYLTSQEMSESIANGMTYFINRDPVKVRAVLLFMFYTGLRIGEIERLKREDINLTEMKALVKIPSKNNEERYTYFPLKVKKALEEYFLIEPETLNAFNLTRKSLWRLVGRLNKMLTKHKKISPHSLRHSFANLLAEKQIGIRVAQKLLWHKSMASTLIYYNPDNKIVEKIYRDNIDRSEKGEKDEARDLGPTKTL